MVKKNEIGELDIGAIEKGDFISEPFLIALSGIDPRENEQLYRFEVLNIRDHIWKIKHFTARTEGFALRVLTDAEATFYNHEQCVMGRRKTERAHQRLQAVDETQLDQPTRNAYRQFLEHESRLNHALQDAVRIVRTEKTQVEPVQTTPPSPERTIKTGDNDGTQKD